MFAQVAQNQPLQKFFPDWLLPGRHAKNNAVWRLSGGEALAIVWLKVVTFAVPQATKTWCMRDCLPAAQSKAKNISAGCARQRRTDGDFRRFLPMLCDTIS
jgi:hypothetical protein